MITLASNNFMTVYNYKERYARTFGQSKYIVMGTDMFDYEDYGVALCDTQDEVDLVCLMREESKQPGGMADTTWVIPPYPRNK